MPFRGRRSNIRRKRAVRRRPARLVRSLRAANPQPIFTETYTKASFNPNTGTTLTFNIGEVPQLTQYNTLYQKYRILKAVVFLLPNYMPGEQNQADANAAAGGGVGAVGMGRIVWATNDTSNTVPPVTELEVLKNNGCHIKPFNAMNVVKMTCRPVPQTVDAGGVTIEQKHKWITFQPPGGQPEPRHFGIDYWYSQPVLNVPIGNNSLNVYVKLTFQLADPK